MSFLASILGPNNSQFHFFISFSIFWQMNYLPLKASRCSDPDFEDSHGCLEFHNPNYNLFLIYLFFLLYFLYGVEKRNEMKLMGFFQNY